MADIATSSGSHSQNATGQPTLTATRGATRPASAVPMLPMPYTPSAKPRRSGGNQRATNGTPTANEAPARPSKKLTPRRVAYDVANPASASGTHATSSNSGNMSRPP